MFARYIRDYVFDRRSQQVVILRAGCATGAHDLGVAQLRHEGALVAEVLIDDDAPAVRAAVAARPALAQAVLGDLRTVPLAPRSADIVECSLLLERIRNAELVLDRLVAAIKPGGLLLLRIRERNSAAGIADRLVPAALRQLLWRARRPGDPGPYPAMYEKVSSARGVQSYVLLRGLVVAERLALDGTGDGQGRGARGILLAQRIIAWLSRDRFTAAPEELLYVLRKPENRFARLLLRARPRCLFPRPTARSGRSHRLSATLPRHHGGRAREAAQGLASGDGLAARPDRGTASATPGGPAGSTLADARPRPIADQSLAAGPTSMEVDVTAEAGTGLAADFTSLPAWTLDDFQLADLELLLSGAFAPLAGYLGDADVASVWERWALADGTPWPVPVTLDLPAAMAPAQDRLLLNDPEGVPLAILTVTGRTTVLADSPRLPLPPGRHARAEAPDNEALVRLSGPVVRCREPEHGLFRRLRRLPAEVRAEWGEEPVLAFATRRPLHSRQIGQLRHVAGQLRARVLLLPLVAGRPEVVRRPDSLVRTVQAAARHLPPTSRLVPVPLAPRAAGGAREIALRAQVAAAYGATHLLVDPLDADLPGREQPGAQAPFPTAIPTVPAGDWAYDRVAEVWRPLSLIEPGTELPDIPPGELEDLLDRGDTAPAWFTPATVAEELRRARPPRAQRGLVVFLTGLSGSGKSTIARGLRDAIVERGDRSVSLLDGDLARDLLSADLTFSRADRDLNIARIGFVAAEVARHGGIAICAPIAPYEAARSQVRAMVAETGDFLLVHVATPAQVCEKRDRKGLYAKARAGLIDNFTGVSDPYEEPRDADLTLDTSNLTQQEAVEAMLDLLAFGGWLPRPGDSR